MKRFLLFCAIWILALSFMLWNAWAQQTNTNLVIVASPAVVTTNAPVVIVPLDARIAAWTDAIQNILLGALSIVATLGLLWGRIMQLKASVVPTLVKTIDTHGTESLKNAIEQASLRAGVETQLNKAVKANTTSTPDNPFPPNPVANPPTPTDVKPL